jgi:regulator of protease activity HflC (stomatin/prohibitin superfamily)
VQKVADKLNKEYREKERIAQAESDRRYSEYENQIKTRWLLIASSMLLLAARDPLPVTK